MTSPTSLDTFIASNPDPRELKRALAVKMTLTNYTHQQIQEILGVTSGFISKWKKRYLKNGVDGLGLAYQGSKPYLSVDQRQDVLNWLCQKTHLSSSELAAYIHRKFGVVYKSDQSYRDLLGQARMSWKKTQPSNPKKDPDQVTKKRDEIKKN